jgi:hypothetical protein
MVNVITIALGIGVVSAFSVYTDLYANPVYEVSIAQGYDRANYLLPDEAQKLLASKDATQRYQPMALFEENYLCVIPEVNKTREENELPTVDEGALQRAYEILHKNSQGCLHFIESYWTYSVCYGKEIQQFHVNVQVRIDGRFIPAPEEGTPIYVLGRFDSDTLTTIGHTDSTNYVSQQVIHGSECDLTQKDRTVEIQYFCSAKLDQDKIMSVKETKTCSYQIIIHTPHLCEDPVFVPRNEPQANEIVCKRILTDDQARQKAAQPSLPQVPASRTNLAYILEHVSLAHISDTNSMRVSTVDAHGSALVEGIRSAIVRAVVDGKLILGNGETALPDDEVSDIIQFSSENGEDSELFLFALGDGDVVVHQLTDDEALILLSDNDQA